MSHPMLQPQMKRNILTTFCLLASFLHAQDRPAPIVSPEVHADRTVTFRLRAPQAREVSVSGEWGEGKPLTKDDSGIWSVTLGPLAPDLYGYGFSVDGLRVLDPANTAIKPMRSNSTSILDVPGAKPSPCDPKPGVPRGIVHLHHYDSKSLGRTRRLRIYTPAVYAAEKEARFPVLYLLHGNGDNEATWTELGRAHVILDNLTADGKARPMVVVMTDGHAVAPGAANSRAQNLPDYEHDLLEDVMPFVEATYRLRPDREGRAIVGLSMGGGQSLTIGLNHLDRFGWVGGMSSAVREPEKTLAPFLSAAAAGTSRPRLLWFACGKDDFLLKDNQRFDSFLTEKKIAHEYAETAGNHSWPVWRRYLADFAGRVFSDN
jgi:enterochelin esterase-like enzyme